MLRPTWARKIAWRLIHSPRFAPRATIARRTPGALAWSRFVTAARSPVWDAHPTATTTRSAPSRTFRPSHFRGSAAAGANDCTQGAVSVARAPISAAMALRVLVLGAGDASQTPPRTIGPTPDAGVRGRLPIFEPDRCRHGCLRSYYHVSYLRASKVGRGRWRNSACRSLTSFGGTPGLVGQISIRLSLCKPPYAASWTRR